MDIVVVVPEGMKQGNDKTKFDIYLARQDRRGYFVP